jgi:ketosteroid isomerase-like protein
MLRSGERILICLSVLLATVPLSAQEWSAEQKEALAFEVAYWKAFADRDQAATLALMHDDYRGWGYESALPGGKASAKTSFAHSFPATKVFYHEVTPIAILVRGNLAVVHYVVGAHYTNEKGEHESGEQRWTDTLIKEGGKWLLLGDHGGPTSELGN